MPLRRLLRRMRQVTTCGYLPDPPTDRGMRWMKRMARLAVSIQVGKVEVAGAMPSAWASPMLIVPTHGHYLDPFVLALALPVRARCMAARGLMRVGGGLGGMVFASWGAFCTDLNPGKGGPALKAALRILESRQTLVMFPEGWAFLDGKVGPFKKGPVAVVRRAEARLGESVPILPVYIRYGAYPGSWIRRFPPTLQYLTMILGFPFFRRGARVVVGAPLKVQDLPAHPVEAAEALRRRVLALGEAS